MFKKILLALAVLACASFATWDYYPIPQNKNGGAEAGLYYDKDHRWSQHMTTCSKNMQKSSAGTGEWWRLSYTRNQNSPSVQGHSGVPRV